MRSLTTALGRFALLLLFCTMLVPATASAQDGRPASLEVFLDCRRCDDDYIRRELPIVDYVRDRKDALVHLLISEERTGSGGRNYQLNFIGLRQFSALRDTLYFASSNTDTSDETRRGLTRVIASGLARYLARTSVDHELMISGPGPREGVAVERVEPDDPWKNWVFNIGMEGDYQAEESQNELESSLRFSASRVTEEWKIRANLRGNYSRNRFELTDRTVTSTTEDGSVWVFVARSINSHWTAGASSYTDTSTRRNTKLSSSVGPSVEYNIFPYSESSLRQIRIQYELRYQRVEYENITVFDKLEQDLFYHGMEVRLDFRQPWGSANGRVEAKQFLTDFTTGMTEYYSVELGGDMNVRLIRGLSLNVGGSVNFVHDQLYLEKKELTEEEILLGTKRLSTSFEYEVKVGFNYSFGSIYNNIVNPRFGF